MQDHVDKINAVGKITIDDIYTRPEAIVELFDSGDFESIPPGPMSPREAGKIFKSDPLTKHTLDLIIDIEKIKGNPDQSLKSFDLLGSPQKTDYRAR